MAGKGGTAIVIGLGRPKGMPMGKPGSDDGDHADDGSAAEDDAVQAIGDALGSKNVDVPALKDALKTFIEVCYPSLAKGSYSEGESEEEG
jgi:hypothetical protein